jgi:hypothetical protein
MNLRNTILTAMSRYPSLYQRPDQVLNQLFLVIGNGYDWKRGQLVSNGGKKERFLNTVFTTLEEEIDREKDRKQKWLNTLIRSAKWEIKQEMADHQEWLRLSGRDLRKRIREKGFPTRRATKKRALANLVFGRIRPLSPYPISHYSYVRDVPDYVRPDWLAGIHWILDFILSNRFTTNNIMGREVKTESDREVLVKEEKKLARKIKRSLNRRFPKEFWIKEAEKLQSFIDKVEAHKKIAYFKETWELCDPNGMFARPKGKKQGT